MGNFIKRAFLFLNQWHGHCICLSTSTPSLEFGLMRSYEMSCGQVTSTEMKADGSLMGPLKFTWILAFPF